MTINQHIIDKAIDVAKKSNVRRGKVGAVLFTSSGEIIAFTSNKTCTGQKDKFTIHAEELLLAKAHKLKAGARFGIPNLAMLVVRWKSSTKKLAMAKPCSSCEFLIKEAGLDNVYYSDESGEIVKLK